MLPALLATVLLLGAVPIASAQNASAERCEEHNLDKPLNVTLFRSTQNADEDAMILYPDCRMVTLSLEEDDGVLALFAGDYGIEIVDSYPRRSGRLYVTSYSFWTHFASMCSSNWLSSLTVLLHRYLDSNAIRVADFSDATELEHLYVL